MCLGVPGRVLAIEPDDRLPMGTVDFGGTVRVGTTSAPQTTREGMARINRIRARRRI